MRRHRRVGLVNQSRPSQPDTDPLIDFANLAPSLRNNHGGFFLFRQCQIIGDQPLALLVNRLAFDNCAKPVQTVERFSVLAGLRLANRCAILLDAFSLGLGFARLWVLPPNFGQPRRFQTGMAAKSIGRMI